MELLPFDLEAFKRDPMRLRYRADNGNVLVRAGTFSDDVVVAEWRDEFRSWFVAYGPESFGCIGLAPKTRKVIARPFRHNGSASDVCVSTDDTNAAGMETSHPYLDPRYEWIKPHSVRLTNDGRIEIEIPE